MQHSTWQHKKQQHTTTYKNKTYAIVCIQLENALQKITIQYYIPKNYMWHKNDSKTVTSKSEKVNSEFEHTYFQTQAQLKILLRDKTWTKYLKNVPLKLRALHHDLRKLYDNDMQIMTRNALTTYYVNLLHLYQRCEDIIESLKSCCVCNVYK